MNCACWFQHGHNEGRKNKRIHKVGKTKEIVTKMGKTKKDAKTSTKFIGDLGPLKTTANSYRNI